MILGALAAAFGGKTGERRPVRDVSDVDDRTTDRTVVDRNVP